MAKESGLSSWWGSIWKSEESGGASASRTEMSISQSPTGAGRSVDASGFSESASSKWRPKISITRKMIRDDLKFKLILSGKTLDSHKDFITRLKLVHLKEVNTEDECDFILVFCPIVSRAGTDIEAAMKHLHDISDTKPVVLVVLHHTFDTECVVPDSSKCVNRKNMIAVDCLFHEDTGLLQCLKNNDSLDKTSQYLKEYINCENMKKQKEGERSGLEGTNMKADQTTNVSEESENSQPERNKQLNPEPNIAIVEDMEKIMKQHLKRLKECLIENAQTLQEKDKTLEENETQLKQTKAELDKTIKLLEDSQRHMEEKNTQLENLNKLLKEKETQLKDTDKELETSTNKLDTLGQELQDKMIVVEQQKSELAENKQQLEEKDRLLTERETQLMERDKQLQEKDKLLEEKTKQLQEQTDPESSATIRRKSSKELLPPKMSEETQDSAAPIRRRHSMEGNRPTLTVAELRLVLLGRTGSGKSVTGNIILGREERNQAATSTATSTATQQSESTQGEVAGRKVTVVDTPDWFSSELSLEKLRQDVGLCVCLSAPGPHAFLLVIPLKQPTGEERGMLEKMEKIFGERCWRNTMIICSVTDECEKKNIEDFIQSGDQEVQRLVEKCGDRFHCLNINDSGDGSQVSELLEKIEKMVEGSREKFYSSDIYLETESQIRAMKATILKERKEKREREEKDMKEKIEKEVQDSLRKIEGVIEEHEGDIRQLNDRTTELERKMKEERDEEKKKELERELKQEVDKRTEMEGKVKKLKEKRERERKEMEERHKQEMEEIREVYEGEIRMEAERKIMKIILPELQRNMLSSKTKMQEDFSRQMEEKNREMENLQQKLSQLTDTHRVLEEVYEKTVRESSERASLKGEASKGMSQKFKGLFK